MTKVPRPLIVNTALALMPTSRVTRKLGNDAGLVFGCISVTRHVLGFTHDEHARASDVISVTGHVLSFTHDEHARAVDGQNLAPPHLVGSAPPLSG